MHKLRFQVPAMSIALVALFAIQTALVFRFVTINDADGAVINQAGRQRMLAQRVAREAGSDPARTATPGLERAQRDFTLALDDLLDGSPSRGLPPARGLFRDALVAQRDAWTDYTTALEAARAGDGDDRALALAEQRLTEAANRSVVFAQDQLDAEVARLGLASLVLGALGGAWTLGFLV